MKITPKMTLVLREAGYSLCPDCKGDGKQWNPMRKPASYGGPSDTTPFLIDCSRCHGDGIVSDSEEEGL